MAKKMLRIAVPSWHCLGMKLSDYIAKQGITLAEFGARVGVGHSAVSRYVNGKRRPNWDTLQRIEAETGGKVTAADFYAVVDDEAAA